MPLIESEALLLKHTFPLEVNDERVLAVSIIDRTVKPAKVGVLYTQDVNHRQSTHLHILLTSVVTTEISNHNSNDIASSQFSVPQIEYPLGGSSNTCSHVYFLL